MRTHAPTIAWQAVRRWCALTVLGLGVATGILMKTGIANAEGALCACLTGIGVLTWLEAWDGLWGLNGLRILERLTSVLMGIIGSFLVLCGLLVLASVLSDPVRAPSAILTLVVVTPLAGAATLLSMVWQRRGEP